MRQLLEGTLTKLICGDLRIELQQQFEAENNRGPRIRSL